MSDQSNDAAVLEESEAQKSSLRDAFTSKTSFIIACVGSAIGVGNIWLFPYRLTEFGGAAFLIPFFLFVVLLGFSGVIGEMAFGRMAQAGPVGAFGYAFKLRFGQAKEKLGRALGAIPTISILALAIGYSVVVGWILKYLFASVTGEVLAGNPGDQFAAIAGNFGSLPWHFLALALTFIVMAFGVSKGIERINKLMMPLFFALFVILLVRVALLPNAFEGYKYLLIPEWSALADPRTWIYALGQAFFSLSLAGSGTIVYGSYLKRNVDVVHSAATVAFFDIVSALLAALVIVPAVFSFGVDLSAGPALIFMTLPTVFAEMPAGQIFAVLFFLAVVCAALTSLVNLFESPIEALENRFKISRVSASCIIALVAAGVGIFIESADAIGMWMDVVSIFLIPLGALMAAVIFFWVCPKGTARIQAQLGRAKKIGPWFEPVTKYVFVVITALVYCLGIFLGGI